MAAPRLTFDRALCVVSVGIVVAGPVVVEFHSVPLLKSSTFLLSVGSLRLSLAHLFVSEVTSCHFVPDLVSRQT